jgi:hypothetical protein
MSQAVDICYVISHGFSARMVLDSTLLTELGKRGLRVGILSPDGDEPSMRERAERQGFIARATPPNALAQAMVSARLSRYLFEDVASNPALYAKHLWDTESKRAFDRGAARAFLSLSRWSRRVPTLSKAATLAQSQLLRRPAIAALLRELDPAVVVSTYPMHAIEASVLLEARRAGRQTVIQLLSWDNVSCKGRFPVLADQYVSWGPVMSAELRTTYGVSSDRIRECGVPHFDQHVLPTVSSLAGVRALGLDAAKPYLFFGMSSPVFAPKEIDVVEWLARAVQSDRFGTEMQLVIRPHPQNVQGGMADGSWLPRLEALVAARVAVDMPRVKDSSLPWSMAEDDLGHLVSLLAGASVTLNSGSTLAIDALMHDKPVVLTMFDADDPGLPWHRSARRLREYSHLATLIQLGGVRPVDSFAALGAAIDGYLQNPQLDAEARARSRREECGPRDGRASERVAGALAALTNRDKSARGRSAS